MPLDALIEEPCLEALIIDQMLDFFGPYGERWIQNEHCDADGNCCVIGALLDAKRKLLVTGDRTVELIYRTVYISHPDRSCKAELIEAWNDGPWCTFAEVAEVLRDARQLAMSGC